MDKKLLVLPLDESLSKLVTKALANETSIKILNILAEEPMSVSKISEILDIPITTAQYNIERLLEAGLIKVKEIKWSRKGREIKIYEPQEKYIIISPKKSDPGRVLTELKKLIPVVSIGIGAIIGWTLSSRIRYQKPLPLVEEKSVIPKIASETPTPAPTPTPTPAPVPTQTPEITYIAKGGGMAFSGYTYFILAIVALLIASYIIWRLRRK